MRNRSRPGRSLNVFQMGNIRVAGAYAGCDCGQGYSGFGPSLASAGASRSNEYAIGKMLRSEA